jgi:hypothetical protein
MPNSSDAMDEVLVRLTNEQIATIYKSLPLTEVEVSLPQLAVVSSDLDMSPFLKRLGLNQLFASPGSKSKQKKGLIKFIKQNAYFATSFVSVNSVGASGIALRKYYIYNF